VIPHLPPRALRLALAALALATASSTAAAERGAGTVYDRDDYPYAQLVPQPLTLPGSLIRIELPVRVNMSAGSAGKPWYVPATLDFGVTNDVQVGLWHEVGACPAGKANGCAASYDDLGGRIRVSLSRSADSQLALDLSALAYDLDDTHYLSGAALAYKRSVGLLSLEARGGLDAVLTDRSHARYRELAHARATGAVQLGRLAALARIGIEHALEQADGADVPTRVPVGFGAELALVRKLVLGAEWDFTNLLGERGTTELRELAVYLRLFI
jgi:hypothetical protein